MYFDLRLFQLTQGVRLRIFLSTVLGLIAVGAGVAGLAIFGIVIARVFRGQAEYSSLAFPMIGVAILIGVRGVFQYLQNSYAHHTSNIVKIKIRENLYQHCLALGPGHFDQRRTGGVILTLGDGVEGLETFFGQYLPQIIIAAVAPILIFVFMAILDLPIALIFLGFALFTLVAPAVFHSWNQKSSMHRYRSYGSLGADFLDGVQGLATLKAYGQSGRHGDRLADKARALYRSTMGVLAANIATGGVTVLGISAGAAVALGVGASRVSAGDMEIRTLLIVMMFGVEVFRPLRELTQLYHKGMIASAAAQSIFNLMAEPVEIEGPKATPTPDTPQTAPLTPEIRFENVTFGYNQGRGNALEEVSFTLGKGEKLGVAGPSGAGKSTLVWLAYRFFDPQKGRILLGGEDLKTLPLERIREQIAVVTQDTYLFHGTVADNLRFGKRDATQEQLEAAARAANAHEFISELPQGYDTYVGERAIRLSGGQRQRIAIARALLKDAPILILDEALSSVDAENEAVIQEALDRLMQGRTTLIIAHRLSSIVGADRILVLEDSHLVEVGSHDELIAADGIYARLMADQQTAGFASRPANLATVDQLTSAVVGPASPPHEEEPIPTPAALEDSYPMGAFTILRRLLTLIVPWWKQQTITFLLGIAHHGSIIGLGVISALLVGEVFRGGDLTLYLILLGVFAPLTAFFTWAEGWLAHDLAYRLLAEMRIDMYRKMDAIAPAYLVKRRSGDIVGVVGGDIEKIEYFFAHTISPAFVAFVVPLAVLITLALISWPLAIVLLPFLLAVAIRPFYDQTTNERLGDEVLSKLGGIHAQMVDNIQGMREISAFDQGPARTGDIRERGWDFAGSQLKFKKAQESQTSFIESITGLGGLAVLAMGAWLVLEGRMDRPDLPLAALLALSTFSPVSDLARTGKDLMETLAAGRRVFAVHDEPMSVQDGPGVAAPGEVAVPTAPLVRFDGTSFAYGPGLPQAVSDLSFTIEPGQTVALVGRSGAGKSTCAYLLMRFWDPQSGEVSLGNHNLKEFRLDPLRDSIAFVTQDTYLFNASIGDNIALGKFGASQEEIEEAASQANAHGFISSFPEGYDTMVGERGMQLSGGQRQRISIARALLKNAPVLILDEATSHLDAVSEHQVRQALNRLMSGRSTVIIAHRLSTVRDADKLIVLDRGRKVEEGSHDELMERNGLYAQLVAAQMVSAGPRPTQPAPEPS